MKRFFCMNGEYTAFFDTASEAQAAAEAAIETLRRGGEWPDEIDDVCWGVIVEEATASAGGEEYSLS